MFLLGYYGLDLLNGVVEVVVDDGVTVAAGGAGLVDFPMGFGQAFVDGLLVVAAAAAESSTEFGIAGRHDKNTLSLGELFEDLQGALDIDLQEHGPAAVEQAGDGLGGCAVVVAKDAGVLEETTAVDLLDELVFVHEIIVPAVGFAGRTRAGGGRDAELDVGLFDDGAAEGALA